MPLRVGTRDFSSSAKGNSRPGDPVDGHHKVVIMSAGEPGWSWWKVYTTWLRMALPAAGKWPPPPRRVFRWTSPIIGVGHRWRPPSPVCHLGQLIAPGQLAVDHHPTSVGGLSQFSAAAL